MYLGKSRDGSVVKNLPTNSGNTASIPRSERSAGVGKGHPSQYLPGKSHGQRSLVGYTPWCHNWASAVVLKGRFPVGETLCKLSERSMFGSCVCVCSGVDACHVFPQGALALVPLIRAVFAACTACLTGLLFALKLSQACDKQTDCIYFRATKCFIILLSFQLYRDIAHATIRETQGVP